MIVFLIGVGIITFLSLYSHFLDQKGKFGKVSKINVLLGAVLIILFFIPFVPFGIENQLFKLYDGFAIKKFTSSGTLFTSEIFPVPYYLVYILSFIGAYNALVIKLFCILVGILIGMKFWKKENYTKFDGVVWFFMSPVMLMSIAFCGDVFVLQIGLLLCIRHFFKEQKQLLAYTCLGVLFFSGFEGYVLGIACITSQTKTNIGQNILVVSGIVITTLLLNGLFLSSHIIAFNLYDWLKIIMLVVLVYSSLAILLNVVAQRFITNSFWYLLILLSFPVLFVPDKWNLMYLILEYYILVRYQGRWQNVFLLWVVSITSLSILTNFLSFPVFNTLLNWINWGVLLIVFGSLEKKKAA